MKPFISSIRQLYIFLCVLFHVPCCAYWLLEVVVVSSSSSFFVGLQLIKR